MNLPNVSETCHGKTNLFLHQPRVKILGYYDEDEMAHIPETLREIVNYLIESGATIPAEYLEYDKGRLVSVQVLEPRKERGYIPVILHTGDFRMEVFI